jgi:3-deoxy-manno-octulosonate cytidylyltransferase (CMP-KDO synthetase)
MAMALFPSYRHLLRSPASALGHFVALPPSPLEKREKLEQLRALEAGMRIDVARLTPCRLSVDTPEDLARARKLIS